MPRPSDTYWHDGATVQDTPLIPGLQNRENAVKDYVEEKAGAATPADGSVTPAKVAGSLKPSGSAVASDEALRALGSGATQAAAGNDSRFPTAGQKNALAGTTGTPGTGNEFVTTSDARMTNARTPTAHTHPFTDVTGAATPAQAPGRFRGAWQATTFYAQGDLVTNGGSLWAANADFTSGGSFVAGNWTSVSAGSGTGLPANKVNRTTAYTAAAGDLVLCDATSGTLAVTLPTNPSVGTLVTVAKTDASANAVTVGAAGGGTVDGDTGGASLDSQYVTVTVEHLGSNAWKIVAEVNAAASAPDATTSSKGLVRLAGDLGGTAASPTVPGLAAKESTANKGASNGYAPLDSNSRVPVANLAAGTPDGTKFLRDDGTFAVPAAGNVQLARITASPQRKVGRRYYLDPTNPALNVGLFDLLGTNAVHTYSITGTPTGGTFTATLADGRVATIPYNADRNAFQALFMAVYGPGNVKVTGGPLPGSNIVVEFVGGLAGQAVPLPTISSAGLTGGSTPTASVASTTTGGAGGWTYTTDAAESSRAVLTPADTSGKGARILTRGGFFRDFQARMRVRVPAAPHTSSTVDLLGRYTDPDNYFSAHKIWNSANAFVQLTRRQAGANNTARQVAQADITDTLVWHWRWRVVEQVAWIKAWHEATSSVYTLTTTATGGTRTLSYGGQTTSALAWNDSAANIQAALRALSSIGGTNVAVSGSAGGPYTITFQGTLANSATTALTSNQGSLTGGTDTVAQTRYGSNGTEPDWQLVGPINPTNAAGVYNDQGQAGALLQVFASGWMLSEFQVEELLATDDNVVFNGDFTILDNSTGLPLGWSIDTPNANSTSQFELVAGPDGITRRFFHLGRTADDAAAGAGIGARLYIADYSKSDRIRQLHTDLPEFATAFEVAVSSMATNLRHLTPGGDFLGLALDCYQYDELDNNLIVGATTYYLGLGPTQTGSTAGTGTWSWRRDVFRIPLSHNRNGLGRAAYTDLKFVLHDTDTAGDAWIGDIAVRPVA